MEKKTMTIIVVAVVAIVIVAAAAFFLMQPKNYNAQELADKFVKEYDGEFGEFEIATGGSKDLASLSQTITTRDYKGDAVGEREVSFQIYHYETKELAEKAFKDFIVNSKNGSKGETLLTQTDKLGMASKFVTIINGSKTIVPNSVADNTEYREVKAGDYGCDQIYIMYAAFQSTNVGTAVYTMAAGAVQDGCNVIVFNQTKILDIYISIPIMDTVGSYSITQDVYDAELKKFVKAF